MEQLISFLYWLKKNNYYLYKDGTWFTTSERPYIFGDNRKFYKEEELILKYYKQLKTK